MLNREDAFSPRFAEFDRILQEKLEDPCAKPVSLPLDFLESITRDFSREQELGRGGFGVVYKGVLRNGKVIAVKKLNANGMHFESDEFQKEVTYLTGMTHENIVQLMGSCDESRAVELVAKSGKLFFAYRQYSLICYEYLTNKSLDKHLSAESSGLEWHIRYEIIKGICCGLHYLHNECHIVHLDLKPQNILMDDNMVPKIADFGMSRLFGQQQSRIITKSCGGTFGYMAPEYINNGLISPKSDIFSFGVIIIELLIGSRQYPQSTEPSFGNFIENVVNRWRNQLEKSSKYKPLDIYCEQVNSCIEIGMKCVHPDPDERPAARDIIEMLSKDRCSGVPGGKVVDKPWLAPASGRLALPPSPSSRQPSQSSGQLAPLLPYKTVNVCESIPKAKHKSVHERSKSAIDAVLAALVRVPLILLGIEKRRMRKYYQKNGGAILKPAINIKIFRKEELEPIVKSYNIIGKDAFGEVYKGLLDEKQVAVELASNVDQGQFVNHVVIQSQIIHRNIVKLIGCCLEVDVPILVYDFAYKDSLDDILHGDRKEPLNLDQRLRIAVESADGLAYMHSKTTATILHGDVKPANILLNDEFVPKISNFGKSRLIAIDKEKHTNYVDRSYMDPVYQQTGLFTKKSDVYSFGVVLLELISRKKAAYADNNNLLVMSFLDAHKKQRGRIELFDKEIITTSRDIELLECVAGIAVECLQYDVDQRPEMTDVAERLLILRRSRDK